MSEKSRLNQGRRAPDVNRSDGTETEATSKRSDNADGAFGAPDDGEDRPHADGTSHLASRVDLLRAGLDIMTDGFALYDAEDRLVLYNRAFAGMWPGIEDAIRPGVRFEDIVRVSIERGVLETGGRDVESVVGELLAARRESRNPETSSRLSDGRWILRREVRMPNGAIMGTRTDVTEIKKRTEELATAKWRAEQLLVDLVRTIEAMKMGVVVVDAELNSEIINRAFYEMWQMTPQEARPGVPFRTLLEFNRHTGIYDIAEDQWEGYVETRLNEIREGAVAPREMARADGRTMIYSVTALSGGKRLISYYDISEMKRREAALRETMLENELFRNIIDAIPTAIYAKRPDLTLSYVNRGWSELTGLTKEQALGRTDGEIFGADGEAFMRDDRQVLETGEAREFEEIVKGPDGYLRYQHSHKNVMNASDGSLYLIGSTTNVTEARVREEELREAQRKAVLADRAKSEFLANMSHEIRTPMNGVLGMAELMAKTDLDAKQRTFVDIIVKSGNALLTIINDILDFSKIDAGQLVLHPAPFDLAEAVEDVATLVSARAKEKDLELIVRMAPGLPAMFEGDVGRIRQIITNLLGNAVKFTDSGHVLVDVSGKVADGAAGLHIAVTDTGIGIPSDKLDLVFDKFSQVDSSSTRRHEGTGLGLAITARLVELMGGEIRVESVEGQGSTFTVELDLPVAAGIAPRRLAPIDTTGARILVIDDNPVNRAIFSEQMKSWKFDACAADSGEEGLRVLDAAHALGLSIDCILLDYQMPGMTGLQFAQTVRERRQWESAPIILLTSVDQSLSAAECSRLGIEAHLVKPARSSHLLETIVSAIHKHRSPRQPAAVSRPAPEKVRPEGGSLPPEDKETAALAKDRLDILVAEDNEVNQMVFTQILRETGLRFEIVADGRLALEAFQTKKPAMILMDVSMPRMNGIEATGAIRQWEAMSGDPGGHVPIVGVTAHALKGDRERCIEAGMDDYISKPISPATLLAKVARWTEGKSGGRREAG